MARFNRWKNGFFLRFILTAGCVAIGHPICIINLPHLTVIIRHNCRLYRIAVFTGIIAFSGWTVNVCQNAHVPLVPPHHSCQVTTLQTECLGLRSLVMSFLCSLTVPQQEFFSGPSRQTGQGRKRSCPRTIYGQILLPSFYANISACHLTETRSVVSKVK